MTSKRTQDCNLFRKPSPEPNVFLDKCDEVISRFSIRSNSIVRMGYFCESLWGFGSDQKISRPAGLSEVHALQAFPTVVKNRSPVSQDRTRHRMLQLMLLCRHVFLWRKAKNVGNNNFVWSKYFVPKWQKFLSGVFCVNWCQCFQFFVKSFLSCTVRFEILFCSD